MCGIAGEFRFDNRSPDDRLDDMLGAMRHRGPDEVGARRLPPGGLGTSRLSIVGGADGRQPIRGARGTLCVFNGEVYNYREIRAELERDGCRFTTSSDGEVIVHLYEKYGSNFIDRLKGMYAGAVYDPDSGRVMLFSDRVGQKPLYYSHESGRRVVFASTLNALRKATGIPSEPDKEAIDCFLSYRIIPAPLTAYCGIRKIPPATLLTFDVTGVTERKYWRFPFEGPCNGQPEEALVAELTELLRKAVAVRMQDSVGQGVFLSGGVDSSLVAAIMAEQSDEPLQTFSVGFEQSGFDESMWAAEVAKHLGTRHYSHTITAADARNCISELLKHFGEPFAFPSAIASYQMSRIAADHATVIFGGDGADELFAGYRRYQHFLAAAGSTTPAASKAAIYHELLASGISDDLKRSLYSDEFREPFGREFPRNYLTNHFGASASRSDVLGQALEQDCSFWLPAAQMVKVDVSSMCHSLEVRTPLLDEDVIDFAVRLESNFKIRSDENKYLLRRVADKFLPTRLARRPKHELAVPLEIWLTTTFRDEVTATLTSDECLQRGYFRPDQVRDFVHNFDSRHAYAVWTLYVLEKWHLEI